MDVAGGCEPSMGVEQEEAVYCVVIKPTLIPEHFLPQSCLGLQHFGFVDFSFRCCFRFLFFCICVCYIFSLCLHSPRPVLLFWDVYFLGGILFIFLLTVRSVDQLFQWSWILRHIFFFRYVMDLGRLDVVFLFVYYMCIFI